jgi:hypothetical protein
MVHQHRLSTLVFFAFSSGSLCACIGDQVDLGESTNPSTPLGSLCENSTTIQGSVSAGSQEELNELAGCEVITGDLFVFPFFDPDFTPLASLVRVDGTLDVGRYSFLDNLDPISDEELARQTSLLDSGWINSLEGFENLTSAGNLWLRGVLAPSLAPLSNLRTLTDGGTLSIGPCLNLSSLTGLENLTGIVDVSLSCNSLVSLSGLNFPRRMRNLTLVSPQLTDLGDFDVEELTSLQIYGTQLENLDALARLTTVGSIDLFSNERLVSADGLAGLEVVGELTISANGMLDHLPDFSALGSLGGLRLTSNYALRRLPSFPTMQLEFDNYEQTFSTPDEPDAWADAAPEDLARYTPDVVEISGNQSLEDVTLPVGWIGARRIEIAGNDHLRSVTLNTTRSTDYLGIASNPLLESVELGDLSRAARLLIAGNPLLPLDIFDDVESFERRVTSGPAVPAPEEPAP